MNRTTQACLLALLSWSAPAADISGARIRVHTRFLSSDLLEGRGTGTRGGDLAAEYIGAQLALLGAKPLGDNGSYFQKVPLVGVETQPSAQLSASRGGQSASFRWLEDFVGVSQNQKASAEFDAEAVFVGHGIWAPQQGWDDFKDADLRGKVAVLFTNEPRPDDPSVFGGRALTYFGRWTYKFEEALRRGAAAAIIIHTTPTAGYGWDVVRNSWGREDPQVKRKPGEAALSFAGWITEDAGARLLALSGKTPKELLAAADSRDFRPIPLGIRMSGKAPARIREIDTRNVIAVIPGSDPDRAREAVIFSAHWDHLGIGTPVNGDSIYNGAVDNATGCAILIEIARAWSALPQKPRRSAIFLAVTAEEGGLRGSEYYAANPAVPPGRTAVALNFDGFYPFGRTADVVVHGAERTTFWPQVEEAAGRMNLTISPDPRPEQGSYYRSDHFPLARVGIPAFSIHMGRQFLGKPAGYGEKVFQDYNSASYHQPSDEFREDWDFSGLEDIAQFGFLLGQSAASVERLPGWKAGDEFQPARERSGVR